MKLTAKIWLLCGVVLGAGALSALYLMMVLSDTAQGYGALLRTLREEVEKADSARLTQVTFKKEVQSWKDILLRGEQPDSLKKYSDEFHAFGRQVEELGKALEARTQDSETQGLEAAFLSAHSVLEQKYDTALRAF